VIWACVKDLIWAVDMEGDVASDLSALHRIDDMYDMGSRRWAQLVPRLIAYPGAVQFRFRMQARQEEEREQDAGPGSGAVLVPAAAVQAPAPPGAAGGVPVLLPGPPSPMKGGKQVGSSAVELRFSDIGDMFSFGG
jgi:hypothetical protein